MPLSSAKKEKTVRGKRIQYDEANPSAPDDGAGATRLPTIEEAIENNMFDDIVIEQLRLMSKNAGYKLSLKGRKPNIIHAIKNEYYRRSKLKPNV